jgi:hypothetical protein
MVVAIAIIVTGEIGIMGSERKGGMQNKMKKER